MCWTPWSLIRIMSVLDTLKFGKNWSVLVCFEFDMHGVLVNLDSDMTRMVSVLNSFCLMKIVRMWTFRF